MLGSEFKKLIRLYESVLYYNDGFNELMNVSEDVLLEMIIDDDEINFLDEEKLEKIYDIAVLDLPDEFKKEVISAVKNTTLGIIEVISSNIDNIFDVFGVQGENYIKLLCTRNLTKEEVETIMTYISELIEYDTKEDISLSFLETAPDYLLSDIIRIKSSIVSYASEDVKQIERLIDTIINGANNQSDDIDAVSIASEYCIILNYLAEKIELFDWKIERKSYDDDEIEGNLNDIVKGVYRELNECVSIENMDTVRFEAMLDFASLIDFGEIDVASRIINIVTKLDGMYLRTLYNIYKTLNVEIDHEEDVCFIEKLCDLDIEYLKRVESFINMFGVDESAPYDHEYLYTDTRVIDRYNELTEILIKNGSTSVDDLFDLDGTLEEKIDESIGEDELENALSYIKDEEEVIPCMLKFAYVLEKK